MTQVFCETVAAELTYHKKQEKSKSHVGKQSTAPPQASLCGVGGCCCWGCCCSLVGA